MARGSFQIRSEARRRSGWFMAIVAPSGSPHARFCGPVASSNSAGFVDALQDPQGSQGDPLAGLGGFFDDQGLRVLRVRMRRVHGPPSVAPPLLLQEVGRRLETPVAAETELSENV